jgi:hypothetical protein
MVILKEGDYIEITLSDSDIAVLPINVLMYAKVVDVNDNGTEIGIVCKSPINKNKIFRHILLTEIKEIRLIDEMQYKLFVI